MRALKVSRCAEGRRSPAHFRLMARPSDLVMVRPNYVYVTDSGRPFILVAIEEKPSA